jgi:hypothetical protein
MLGGLLRNFVSIPTANLKTKKYPNIHSQQICIIVIGNFSQVIIGGGCAKTINAPLTINSYLLLYIRKE